MTIDEAKAVLAACVRDDLSDHAFGDAEVYWEKDGEEVASGYFGKTSEVGFTAGAVFTGDEAVQLRDAGKGRTSRRNDTTGPAEFQQGQAMPGLSLESVRKELETPTHGKLETPHAR